MSKLRSTLLVMLILVTTVGLGWLPGSSYGEEPQEACQEDVETCVAQMRKAFSDRGTLGFQIVEPEANTEDQGKPRWVVARVMADGAAFDAGLRQDDIITGWNGRGLPVGVPEPFLRNVKVGQKIELSVIREGTEHVFSAVAKKPTEQTMEAWLMGYVYAHFSKDVFEEYRAKVVARLAGQ